MIGISISKDLAITAAVRPLWVHVADMLRYRIEHGDDAGNFSDATLAAELQVSATVVRQVVHPADCAPVWRGYLHPDRRDAARSHSARRESAPSNGSLPLPNPLREMIDNHSVWLAKGSEVRQDSSGVETFIAEAPTEIDHALRCVVARGLT